MSRERAIEKINAEMQKDPANKYMEAIGHYLIDRAGADEAAAQQILDSKMDLKGTMSKITKKARTMAKNSVAVMSDTEVFDIVCEAWGISNDHSVIGAYAGQSRVTEQRDAAPVLPEASKLASQRIAQGIDLNLEDFF